MFGTDLDPGPLERDATLFEPRRAIFHRRPVLWLLEVQQQHVGGARTGERADHGGGGPHVQSAEDGHEHDRPLVGRRLAVRWFYRGAGIAGDHVDVYRAAEGCSTRAKKRSISLSCPAITSTSLLCSRSSGLG